MMAIPSLGSGIGNAGSRDGTDPLSTGGAENEPARGMTAAPRPRILVTGARGFWASVLIRRLAASGAAVRGLTRRDGGSALHRAVPEATVPALAAEIATFRPDRVFHLAGAAVGDRQTLYTANVGYAATLFDALDAAECGDCPVLLIGSAAEYGLPDAARLPLTEDQRALPADHYGASKLAQTHLALTEARRGRPVVIARPFNIIGPAMPSNFALASFARQAAAIARGAKPAVIEVGNLDASRDFVDVGEATEAIEALMTAGPWGEIVNICSGRPVTIRVLLERLLRIAGVPAEIRVDPFRLRPVDAPVHFGSTEKLRRITGKAPGTDLDATMRRIWRHAMEEAACAS